MRLTGDLLYIFFLFNACVGNILMLFTKENRSS